MKYGTLVISTQHIPAAQGPYMVVHTLEKYLVCVSLDNKHSINIDKDAARPIEVSSEIVAILRDLQQ